MPLIAGLIAVFGLQIFYGLRLIEFPRTTGNVSIVGDVLIASLLIGIGRAWELVGGWDTGIVTSIRRLFSRADKRGDG